MVLTRCSILVSVCSSSVFSVRRAAATTSSIVLCPNFWTSVAKVCCRAPKKASTACRSEASSSRGWSLLASFSASPASSTMSLEPFFRFLSAAQALSLTDPMPRRVSRASFASSQVAYSSKLELEPGNFVGVFSYFSELKPLVQLCQPVGQDVLAVVVLRHRVYDEIHVCCWKIL